MTIDLTDRIALVTGASRGIGSAIASSLAECGANVAIHFRSSANTAHALEEQLGGKGTCFQADLASVSDTVSLYHRVREHFGRVDILVNNAGVSRFAPIDASLDVWEEAWQTTMSVNLRASELLTRLAIQDFRWQGGGRIIYIASRAAFRGDTPDYLAYAASKGGIVALARSVARGCGKDGVRAFVVAPGFTRTDMAQEFIDEYGEEYVSRDIALDRMTEPADIAPIVALLASGMADHATGSTIDVNAGSYVH